MKKIIQLIFLCCPFLTIGQDVSFLNKGDLLQTAPDSVVILVDCTVDMNGDFLDDVVRTTTVGTMYIDYQQLDGSFSPLLFDLPIENKPTWSICAGDLTNNGYNDLLFASASGVSFLVANSDGTDYTEQISPISIFSQRSNLADIDNDGDLDAFVCHDLDQSHAYRNDGSGNMVYDPQLIFTSDSPGNYSSIWTDYDNDGDPDLYITKCKGGAAPDDIDRINLLYRNNNDGTFTEVGAEAGIADAAQSWTTTFEDFDNDGDFDAFVVNHYDPMADVDDTQNRFYMNNGDGTFTDIIDSTGIIPNDLNSFECIAADFNNDGYMDIFSEMSKRLYLGNGDLTFDGVFVPVTPGAIGDLNDDGFLDVIRFNNLWINKGNDNNWLKINLIGVESNPNGIGARVEIYGDWGVQTKELRSGESFRPMNSLQVHFGLGLAEAVDKIVVNWPSGIITVIDSAAINVTHTIIEEECILPASQLVINGNTAICPGDSVELIAPDGFSYEWSNGDSVQSVFVSEPGMYFAIMTDSFTCLSISNTVTINFIEEVPPTIEADSFTTLCVGDSVTLTTSSDVNPIWSNGMAGQQVTVGESGDYSVSIDAQCSTDLLASDTIAVTVVEVAEPVVTGTTILQGESIEITAEGNDLHWYDTEVGGELLGTGNTFDTGPLNTTATYYVEARASALDEEQSGGKPDFDGNGSAGGSGFFNYFNAWEPFILQSVLVNVPTENHAGETTILLVTVENDTLEELTLVLTEGDHVIPLDFEIPVDDSLSLRNPQGNLFRNNGDVEYPYPIGDVGEITTSFLGMGFYFHFYDWKISKGIIECTSDRVPVTIDVTGAEEAFHEAGFSIFPNPTSGHLFVKMENAADRIALFNAQGQIIFEKNTFGQTTEPLAVNHLAAGMYFIQVEADGKTYQTKFVKE